MNTLIVYAHQEPNSFNGALKDLAVSYLTEQGHEVKVSDLYAMKFKAAADQGDFIRLQNPEYFKLGPEQKHAQENDLYTEDIKQEHEKLLWADSVIFQFPMYWFSLPAILKGWVDRVLGVGFAYGGGMWYEDGGLKGKRAILSFTTGGPSGIYSPHGRNGDMELLLWPIQNGILRFVGFDVLPPFITWGPAQVSAKQRENYLNEYRERLSTLYSTTPLFFHSSEDYDEKYVLVPGVEPKTRFQTHLDA